jgi:hypothetical protein
MNNLLIMSVPDEGYSNLLIMSVPDEGYSNLLTMSVPDEGYSNLLIMSVLDQITQWPKERYKKTNNDLQNIYIKLKIE